MDKLYFNELSNRKAMIVGKLTEQQIELLELSLKPADITIWSDRIKHIDKHKKDFINEQSYYEAFESIPDIINKPDYLGYKKGDNSLVYIKQITGMVLVAVRISKSNSLNIRTMYPLR